MFHWLLDRFNKDLGIIIAIVTEFLSLTELWATHSWHMQSHLFNLYNMYSGIAMSVLILQIGKQRLKWLAKVTDRIELISESKPDSCSWTLNPQALPCHQSYSLVVLGAKLALGNGSGFIVAQLAKSLLLENPPSSIQHTSPATLGKIFEKLCLHQILTLLYNFFWTSIALATTLAQVLIHHTWGVLIFFKHSHALILASF